MSQSSVELTPRGPIMPDTSAVQAAVLELWQAAFGNDLNPDPATPQGQLITSQTALIQDKNNQLAFLANQFNPDTASDVWQDALGRIYFLDRQPARPTVVRCVCVGLEGTAIPAGALAEAEDGRRYQCRDGGVIGADGTVDLAFEAVTPGPIVCPAHTITRILTVVPGWDTVDNPDPGVIGQDVESRAAFEARRRASVARNGTGSVRAIYAAVAAVDGVLDCLVRENVGDTPKLIGSVALAPHSVYVSVTGGDDADIAKAIAERKSAGAAMTGNTSRVVVDEITGAEQIITWERPATVRFGVRTTIRVNSSTSSDIEQRIRAAVLASFEGAETCAGQGRVTLGDTVYASRFYAGIIAAGVTDLLGVRIAAPYTDEATADWAESVSLEINESPALAAEDILIVNREA